MVKERSRIQDQEAKAKELRRHMKSAISLDSKVCIDGDMSQGQMIILQSMDGELGSMDLMSFAIRKQTCQWPIGPKNRVKCKFPWHTWAI